LLLWKTNCINWGFLKDFIIHYFAYFSMLIYRPTSYLIPPSVPSFSPLCFTVTSPNIHSVLCFTYCLKPAQITIWNWTFLSMNIYLFASNSSAHQHLHLMMHVCGKSIPVNPSNEFKWIILNAEILWKHANYTFAYD